MTDYKIESVGASFTEKEMGNLATHLTKQSNSGWELHSVFAVEKKGCFGMSEGQTYLAIYKKEPKSGPPSL